MRKRTLKIFIKGESKAYALMNKYANLGYLCWISVFRNEYHRDPENMIYRFCIKLGEKCPWYA